MFYKPHDGHGLPHNPFNAIIAPRPIGWISTYDANGMHNLAPYSFFNAVSYVPPQVMFSSTSHKPDQENTKDTVANIRATGEFCVNIVSFSLREHMNQTSATLPKDVDEFEHCGIEYLPCETINCRRVAKSPAALECRVTHILPLLGENNVAVFGQVTGIHMRDDCVIDGHFDVHKAQILARLGYRDYTTIETVFSLTRPDEL